MKVLSHLGLTIFIIGIIIFFLREFRPNILGSLDGSYIDYVWPVGLLIYGISSVLIKKAK